MNTVGTLEGLRDSQLAVCFIRKALDFLIPVCDVEQPRTHRR